MTHLIAQGTEASQRWRTELVAGVRLTLGRGAVDLSVPWDDRISREHAELIWREGRLELRRRPSARNPIFFEGREVDLAFVLPGQHFVVGRTDFCVSDDEMAVSQRLPRPVEEQTFSPQLLEQVRFHDADQRIEVLKGLPDVITGSANDRDLCLRLTNLLLAGIPRAEAAAMVALEEPAEPGTPSDSHTATAPRVRVLYWDRRRAQAVPFAPSQSLILDALAKRQSVLHVWGPDLDPTPAAYTVSESIDWAFATPVLGSSPAWALYVAGSLGGAGVASRDLREDLKFAELVAAILAALRQVRTLQSQNAVLSQFFSPLVVRAMASQTGIDVLTPRETDVAVMFCDLRGFSLEAEKSSANLLDLLERVSRALGVMTRCIRASGGVVGDYQGDAAMGFWGWPLEQRDAVERACLTALRIRAEFEQAASRPDDPLAGFRVGIGVASGRAVAGKIGTDDQVKVTVFGPVVNLASRLEGMTKILRAPILIDARVAEVVRHTLAPAQARCRRLAVVKPYGLNSALEVSELVPPQAQFPLLADDHLRIYDDAVDALRDGRWDEAFDLLHRVPPEDRVKDFLTVLIAQHHRTPPTNWDGVIRLSSKG